MDVVDVTLPDIKMYENGKKGSDEPLPEYYKMSRIKSTSIDYLTIIMDDIRNYRTLNKLKLDYVSKLSHEQKQTIIEVFNECMAMVEDIIKEE